MELIACPNCGNLKVMIYESLDLRRAYLQDEEGIDPGEFDEEWCPTDDPLTIICMKCSHDWKSDYSSIDDLV